MKAYSLTFNLREKCHLFPTDNFSEMFEMIGEFLYFYIIYNMQLQSRICSIPDVFILYPAHFLPLLLALTVVSSVRTYICILI